MPTPWMRGKIHPEKPWWRYIEAAERQDGDPVLQFQTDEERAHDALKQEFDSEARNRQPAK
jgi:hypothetical protein